MENKIAIISDVHSNYYCFDKVLSDIKNRKIKEIIFLGDYITDGFDNNKVLNIIKKYDNVIAGNRELSIALYDGHSWENISQFSNMLYTYKDISNENMQYLKTLPQYKIINLYGKKICLAHGSPTNPREIILPNSVDLFDRLIDEYNCDIYLLGHMHIAYNITFKEKLFINPGSVILPADTPTSKYGILDLDTNLYEQVSIEYNFEELRNYYINSTFFENNKEWCNILIHTNESGFDYICDFADFVKEKAQNECIDISTYIPNDLWHASFLEFMKLKNLRIYF